MLLVQYDVLENGIYEWQLSIHNFGVAVGLFWVSTDHGPVDRDLVESIYQRKWIDTSVVVLVSDSPVTSEAEKYAADKPFIFANSNTLHAIAILYSRLKNYPDLLGEINLKAGKLHIKELSLFLSLNSHNVFLNRYLADSFCYIGDFKEAMKFYKLVCTMPIERTNRWHVKIDFSPLITSEWR